MEQGIEWYRSHIRCSDTRMLASHIIRNSQVKQETWTWNPSGVPIWNPSVDNHRQFKQNQMEFFFIHELHSEWLFWDSILLRGIIICINPKPWFITLRTKYLRETIINCWVLITITNKWITYSWSDHMHKRTRKQLAVYPTNSL